MSCLPQVFSTFRPVVERWYLACCDDAGVTPAEVPLKLEDLALEVPRTFRSEFAAVTPPPAVRITWNGLASLWAFSQAVVRVGRPMFEAQRTADPTAGPPQLAIGGELEEGMHLFELSSRLSRNKFDGWVDWAPVPDPDAVGASLGGNRTFENALGWIMRHELAHLRLNHHAVAEPLPHEAKEQEFQADAQATHWMKGSLQVDPGRALETRPSETELDLERRALGMFTGLAWVAQFELVPHGNSSTHPPVMDRIGRMIGDLRLADDSFACEMLSYVTKVLVDPEGVWPPDQEVPTAKDAAMEAMFRLSRAVAAFKG